MILGAYRRWRRERVLQASALDEASWEEAVRHFPFAWTLGDEERSRLRDLVVVFVHEKDWSVAGGLQLTPAMQVWVALQACILVLNLGLDYYRGWSGIILYPAQFVPRHQHVDETGVVHESEEASLHRKTRWPPLWRWFMVCTVRRTKNSWRACSSGTARRSFS